LRLGFVLHQFFPRHHTGTEQYARALAHEARRLGHDARVFTYEPALARSEAPRSVVDDDFEGIPVRRAALGRGVEANPVLAEWSSPLLGAEFRRWLADFAPQRVDFFHLLGVGLGAFAEACAAGIPTIAHATDFFAACPIATLTLPDGTPCDGPPDGGLGCFGCIHGGVRAALESEELLAPARAISQLSGGLHAHRPLIGALALGLAGRREAIVSQLSNALAVAAPSRFLLESLARHGVAIERLRLVPYGLDLTRLAGLREASGGVVTFGYVGTIAPHKGVLPLARAFRASGADARLLVLGKPREFPDYGAEVEAEARRDPRIELRGPFAPAELGAVLSEIDVLVVPSLWHENTPFVALEALAARRPVIASDRGGLAEIVGPGRGGALVAPGDEGALARAIEEFSRRETVERARAEIAPPRTIAEAFSDLWRLSQS
jgi:glycosyltransferase involved in cell wall biosynthesis